jgi:hypothetical protein
LRLTLLGLPHAKGSRRLPEKCIINCPFDAPYLSLFNAIVFAVHDSGFRPRCALEANNAGQFRLEKIMKIISECKYSIHDISRTEIDPATRLPRFNMPFELGIDIGCRKFGTAYNRSKEILVLDTTPYRYQKFISDIAGQDVYPHAGKPDKAINQVRNWLRAASGKSDIPSGSHISQRYRLFGKVLPYLCKDLKLDLKDLSFIDFSYLVVIWLQKIELSVKR